MLFDAVRSIMLHIIGSLFGVLHLEDSGSIRGLDRILLLHFRINVEPRHKTRFIVYAPFPFAYRDSIVFHKSLQSQCNEAEILLLALSLIHISEPTRPY